MLWIRKARALRVLVPVVMVMLLAAAPDAPAQESPPAAAPASPAAPAAPASSPSLDLAERFPPGTLLVVRMKNLQRFASWIGQSPVSRLVHDPEVKPLWDQLGAMMERARAEARKEIGVDLFAMAEQMRGEFALGITRFQFAGMTPSVGMLLAVDCRDGAEAFRKDLEALLEQIPEGKVRRAEREVKGTAVRVFAPVRSRSQRRDPLAMIGPVHLAWMGSVLVMGNDKSGFDQFLQASAGDDQIQTLGQTENWRDTMARLQGAGDLTMFMNLQIVAELAEMFAGMAPQEGVGAVVAALGLDQFPALGVSATYSQNGVVSRSLLRYTGDGKSGLGSLMTFKKSDLTIPGWVPEDAMQVMLLNYDMAQAFTGLSSLIRESSEDFYENFQEMLEEFRMDCGLSLGEDLLPAIGGPIVIASFPEAPRVSSDEPPSRGMLDSPLGMQAPTLIGIPIKNRRTLERLFEIFESPNTEVTEYKGATLYSAPSFDGENPMLEAAITDRYVLIGFGSRPLVRPAVQRMGGNETGFAGLKAVREALAGLPQEGVGLAVTHYGKSFAYQLNMMKVLAKLIPDARMLARFPMPSSAVIEKYIGYGADVITYEPGVGLMSESRWLFKKP